MLSVHDIRPLYTYTQIDGLVKPCNCRSINWSVDSDFVTSLCEVKMKVLLLHSNVHRRSIFRVRSGLLFAIRSMLCAWTDCSRARACFIICHAQLSRPSLPLQTSRPAPPPASKLSKRFKFAKEEKFSHVKSLLKAWFLKE